MALTNGFSTVALARREARRRSMPLIPYRPADVNEPPELVAAVRARRGGTLLNLDRMLLHSPAYTRGWNALLGAVRSELTVPAKLRELAICAVSVLTGAEYETRQHAPLFLAAGGTEAQLAGVRVGECMLDETDAFDDAERAVLRLAIEMTRDVAVGDSTLDAVLKLLGERATVELVGVVATYNMVSRFLVALGVEPE
jgi:alkylhydroperoxidase family enzyme